MTALSGFMNCYAECEGTQTTASLNLVLPMATAPGTSGIFSWLPLVVYNSDPSEGSASGIMNLTVLGPDRATTTSSMNLYAGGVYTSASAYLPLFVAQSGVAGSLWLYASGEGITPGAVPITSSMNLAIARQPAERLLLFCQGPGTTIQSSGVPLYTFGAIPSTGSLYMYASGVGRVESSLDLFAGGWG